MLRVSARPRPQLSCAGEGAPPRQDPFWPRPCLPPFQDLLLLWLKCTAALPALPGPWFWLWKEKGLVAPVVNTLGLRGVVSPAALIPSTLSLGRWGCGEQLGFLH